MGDYNKMYRDVMLNIEIPRKGGDPFIAELQVALSGISILKKSEQVVYTIMRMKRPADLVDTFVFDHDLDAPLSSTSPKIHDAYTSETTLEIDFGDVAVEVEKADMLNDQTKTVQEPEMFLREQTEAPLASGFMQGMFSCACGPCEPASGDRVLVSAPAPSTLPRS